MVEVGPKRSSSTSVPLGLLREDTFATKKIGCGCGGGDDDDDEEAYIQYSLFAKKNHDVLIGYVGILFHTVNSEG